MKQYIANYQRWLNNDSLTEEIKTELHSLTDEKEIEDRFYKFLQFGTAGLRGIMGAGTNRMNIYTVRKASEGYANYLLQNYEDAQGRGIAIAYDSRQRSEQFAREVAALFASKGMKTYLYSQLTPTPMLSFAVRHLHAVGGIVITASHNPPEYNGYKVYNEDGCQISTDVANAILQHIQSVPDEFLISTLDFSAAIETGLIEFVAEETVQAYYDQVISLSLQPELVQANADAVTIVYTPLHGTGYVPVTTILKQIGFSNIHIVAEQALPDPLFSTVGSPNPEESQAFTYGIQLANDVNADVILGTDPDADRIGIVIKDASGNYTPLNGNQIGSLLLHYILEQQYKQQQLPDNSIAFKTIVTSDLGKKICNAYNVHLEDTLTGFKYIGDKIREYEISEKYSFLFGYEESYGCLIGSFVRDKDAVQAAMLAAEMVLYYKLQGLTLFDVLEQLYQQFGYYVEDQLSFTFAGITGNEAMNTLLSSLRSTPLTEMNGIAVKDRIDYLLGAQGLPAANVIKFILEDESWIAIRPSGTEPKLKCYFSVAGKNHADAQQKLAALKNFVKNMYFA